MIRLIVRTVDIGAAANVGGPVSTTHRTFDVSLPGLEQYLRNENRQWCTCEVIGAEVIGEESEGGNG